MPETAVLVMRRIFLRLRSLRFWQMRKESTREVAAHRQLPHHAMQREHRPGASRSRKVSRQSANMISSGGSSSDAGSAMLIHSDFGLERRTIVERSTKKISSWQSRARLSSLGSSYGTYAQ